MPSARAFARGRGRRRRARRSQRGDHRLRAAEAGAAEGAKPAPHVVDQVLDVLGPQIIGSGGGPRRRGRQSPRARVAAVLPQVVALAARHERVRRGRRAEASELSVGDGGRRWPRPASMRCAPRAAAPARRRRRVAAARRRYDGCAAPATAPERLAGPTQQPRRRRASATPGPRAAARAPARTSPTRQRRRPGTGNTRFARARARPTASVHASHREQHVVGRSAQQRRARRLAKSLSHLDFGIRYDTQQRRAAPPPPARQVGARASACPRSARRSPRAGRQAAAGGEERGAAARLPTAPRR